MRKSIAAIAIILLLGLVPAAHAQTATQAGLLRQTFDDTTSNLGDPPGGYIGLGSMRLFKPVFIEGLFPTDQQLNQPYGLFFRPRWDANVAAGSVVGAYSTIGINANQTAITGGELRMYMGVTLPGPFTPGGGSGGEWYYGLSGNQPFYAHAPSAAYTGRISNSNEGLLRYDRTAQRWQVSMNGGTWGNLLRAGDTGIVTSVGLAISPGTLYTVTGSPVTSTGTLTATLNTQSANLHFVGPASGAAAQPSFRSLVSADIPNGIVTFGHWASNSCATGNIPKWNGTAWACAGDDTSPGGSSWLTAGNTLGATGARVGSIDAFDWDIVRGNTTQATVDATGVTFAGRIASTQTTAHAFQTATTQGGSLFGYYKMTQRTNVLSGVQNTGATESIMYMDSADSHVYIKEGTGTPFRVSSGSVTFTAPTPEFTVTGSGTSTIALTRTNKTWIQWTAKQGTQPTTAFATFDTRNDHPILDFSDAASDTAIWEGMMPEDWDGASFDVLINWTSGTAVTGNFRWESTIERNDTATDIDADSWGTPVLVTVSAPTTSGFIKQTTFGHGTAAQRDSVAAGEAFRLRIRRLGSDALDTATGSAQIISIEIRKT
jgi:hypothetical protein